jgi:multidrug efflux pump
LEIEIDRDKALGLGVSMADISKSIELLFAGVDVTDFNQDGEKYDVVVKLPRDQKSEIRKLGEFAIRTKSGSLVQISNLIKVKETVGIDEISHYNRKKSVTIGASPKQGLTPTDALNELEKLARDVIAASKNKPADIEIDYLGTSKETRDSSNALYFGFVIALVFAYLFLAGQFESFVSPLVIMLTVPLALVGGLLGIWAFQFFPFITKTLIGVLGDKFFWLQYVIPQFTNISINIYSQVGMIMLIGLSTKNGILLVEFMTQLMEKGMSAQDAVIEAARLRLRPVLMTALATILGILPIALALGVGTQSRQSLGVVIVAGLFLSSFLTLYVIPCAFLILRKSKQS